MTGYVVYAKSIEYLLKSDLLLLVTPKVKNNQGILTGKFFEYLASRVPVLAIGPTDGDLARIIGETGCGELFDYADAQGMLSFMSGQLNHSAPLKVSQEKAAAYSRKQLTGKIAEILNAK